MSVEYCNKISNLEIHELPKKWTRMKYWIVKFKIDIAQNLVEQGLPKSWTQHSGSIQELYSENRSQIALFLAEIWLPKVEKPAQTGFPGHTKDTDHNKYSE